MAFKDQLHIQIVQLLVLRDKRQDVYSLYDRVRNKLLVERAAVLFVCCAESNAFKEYGYFSLFGKLFVNC